MFIIMTRKYPPCTAVIGLQMGYHACDRSTSIVLSVIGYELIITLGLGPRKEDT